jgi:kynurenine 3-monooxygenase
MLKKPGFNFSQHYIEHGYLELCIPPAKGGGVSQTSYDLNNLTTYWSQFKMPENYLHIWPRGKFMMIALPNQDFTWTVTLFMPFENFNDIKTSDDLLSFFGTYFVDSIPLIGEECLIKDFFKTRPQHLVSIKCNPYHISSKVMLIGDAGHAVVPFYGQGMNAGFEDCSILTELFNQHGSNLEMVLSEFSKGRHEDAHAISDLAMYNYIEMRDLVNKRCKMRFGSNHRKLEFHNRN